jgi:hypothetical protein
MILGLVSFVSVSCTVNGDSYFGGDEVISEGEIRPQLEAIVFARCIETGGKDLKLLEAYIFVDKLFSKSSGTSSQRRGITYLKKDWENCRNSVLVYPLENCDFKPYDLANFVSEKALCKLEPSNFFQF